MAERVMLIGMMGSGKSTVGRLLADRLGWRYVDSDEDIVRATGRTVREIFEQSGEAAFRHHESDVLRGALTADEDAVVAVAGGAVLDESNRQLLGRSGTVVWLRAPVAVLAERAVRQAHRPLLDGDPAAALARLYDEREPLYRSVADVIVDVDGRTPAEVADAVLAELK